jgi:AbrB family looped-hinge helix DNA binding protein
MRWQEDLMETTLDRFGRIVIPKAVRDDLGLRPGSVLELRESGDDLLLSPRRDEPDLVREEGVLVYTGEATGDLEDAVEQQRRHRLRRLGGWSAG